MRDTECGQKMVAYYALVEREADAFLRRREIGHRNGLREALIDAAYDGFVRFLARLERADVDPIRCEMAVFKSTLSNSMKRRLTKFRREKQLTHYATSTVRAGFNPKTREARDGTCPVAAAEAMVARLYDACDDAIDRRILDLRYEGVSVPTIARIVDLDPTTVNRRIARLRSAVGFKPRKETPRDHDEIVSTKPRQDERRSRRRDAHPCGHVTQRA